MMGVGALKVSQTASRAVPCGCCRCACFNRSIRGKRPLTNLSACRDRLCRECKSVTSHIVVELGLWSPAWSQWRHIWLLTTIRFGAGPPFDDSHGNYLTLLVPLLISAGPAELICEDPSSPLQQRVPVSARARGRRIRLFRVT